MAGDSKFLGNFLWGTATSATQVEGHVVNEWTDYVTADGGNCRVVCDHYHRYAEDVDWITRVGEFYRSVCAARAERRGAPPDDRLPSPSARRA